MPALLLAPLTLLLLCALLAGLSWYEERVLSPQALILHCARCRSAHPEHAEQLVADQSARLLAKAGALRTDARPQPAESPLPDVTVAARAELLAAAELPAG